MPLIRKTFITVILFISLISCGFKVSNNSSITNFTIENLEVQGDRRINFKLKNDLLALSSPNNKDFIAINLTTKKLKNIKEKNIRNEIVKYQIVLTSTVKFNVNSEDKLYQMEFSVNGDYLASSSYSKTLSNEKKLIDNLTKELSKNIQNKISLRLNDL